MHDCRCPHQADDFTMFAEADEFRHCAVWNEDGHPVLSRTLPTLKDIEEEDLYKTDEEICDKAKDKDVKMTMATRLVGMANDSRIPTLRHEVYYVFDIGADG